MKNFSWLGEVIAYSGIFNPERGPLFFILHPGRLLEILAGNFFFFLPGAPALLKSSAMLVLLFSAAAGWRLWFRKQPFPAWTCLYYLVGFLLGKGYLSHSFSHELHTRRLLSFLVLLALLCFRGLQSLFRANRASKAEKAFSPSETSISSTRSGRLLKTIAVLTFLVILGISFSRAHRQALAEVSSIPDRGAYVLAQYFRTRPQLEKSSLFYLDRATFSYYLGREPQGYFPPARRMPDVDFLDFLREKTARLGIKRIAFNFYLAYPDARVSDTRAKKYLINNADNLDLWMARPLYHRGDMAACLLYPRFCNTAPRLNPGQHQFNQ